MPEYFQIYLNQIKFNKQLKCLQKKLKGKKVIIYGTGTFFQFINSNYDLSVLNIIGISDMKYAVEQEGNEDLGYKIIPKSSISKYNPDYVLVATENYIKLIENLEYNCFRDTNIKLLPLAKKNVLQVIKKIWNLK